MRGCVIERESKDGVDIVRLKGALDAYCFPRLSYLLDELSTQHRARLIFECSGLHYISSVALGGMVTFARRAHEQGGDLKLVAVSPKIMSVIELFGFHKILEISPDLPAAIAAFHR